jgi:hypothetical protein
MFEAQAATSSRQGHSCPMVALGWPRRALRLWRRRTLPYAAGTIPEVPAWLLALLRPVRKEAGINGNGAAYSRPPGAAGSREVAYAKAALAGIHDELSRTAEGGRNEALYKSAFKMGRMVGAGWIGEDGARSALTDAATRCGLDQGETSKTISSGLKGGMADPHPPLDDRNSGQQGHRKRRSRVTSVGRMGAPRDLPNNLPTVEPFDQDLLPEQIAPWVMDISDRMQCPPDFVAVPAVIAMGSLIGRKIGIRPQNKGDWLEVPNPLGVHCRAPRRDEITGHESSTRAAGAP